MFKGQPKGLFALALANTGERFGYYTMLAIFVLFIQAKFGFSSAVAGQIYGIFLGAVYFMPLLGGIIADKIGYGKCVLSGVLIMFLGYLALSMPAGANIYGMLLMFMALGLISIGTGLFKGNLQVMVGKLYDNPKLSNKRDSAFSLFYMAINIGAMFAPSTAAYITKQYLAKFGLSYSGELTALCRQFLDKTISTEALAKLPKLITSTGNHLSGSLQDFCNIYILKLSHAYNIGFAVACVSLVLSLAIYLIFRRSFKHVEYNEHASLVENIEEINEEEVIALETKAEKTSNEDNLSPTDVKRRIIALGIVFVVVIFFWMAFHQNGLTLTFFARDYTNSIVQGISRFGFNIWILALVAVSIYTVFGIFQSSKKLSKFVYSLISLGLWAGAYALYRNMPSEIHILPQVFQQFNPFFVVALTPVSVGIFSLLAKYNSEPSAPKKIASGMFVACLGFMFMTLASVKLLMPQTADGPTVGVNVLISTYLILTFAELLLSPMGISFVSKVAPPKYKGMMMGGWFAATAIGNYLTFIPATLWNKTPLWFIWAVLAGLCALAGLFLILFMKKLESATK